MEPARVRANEPVPAGLLEARALLWRGQPRDRPSAVGSAGPSGRRDRHSQGEHGTTRGHPDADPVPAALSGHSPADVHLSGSLVAFFRLRSRLSDPASTWPAPSSSVLPGPVLYWVAQLFALAALSVLGVVATRVVRAHRDGTPS